MAQASVYRLYNGSGSSYSFQDSKRNVTVSRGNTYRPVLISECSPSAYMCEDVNDHTCNPYTFPYHERCETPRGGGTSCA